MDIEASCARCGWSITAVIRNVDAPVYSGFPSLVMPASEAAVAGRPLLLPLFRPANRRAAWQHAVSLGAEACPSLVDPTSILPSRVELGEGVYINAGCTLGAAARLGRFAFVNRGASLGHHLDLGEFASIGPGAVIAGQVTIGAGAMIGAGAVILPQVKIGAGAIVGAGTVVLRDVAAGTTVVGKAGA